MSVPNFPLGVALMDDDHAHIEAMLRMVRDMPDEGLRNILAELRAEISGHFAREEVLMRSQRVPALECHVAQHARILAEIDAVVGAGAAMTTSELRTYLVRDLANAILSHIASVDQMSARFLRGELDDAQVARLRLPEARA